MNKYNILKIIAIIAIVVSFITSAGWMYLAVYNHNINIKYILESVTCFIMGICLALIVYFEW